MCKYTNVGMKYRAIMTVLFANFSIRLSDASKYDVIDRSHVKMLGNWVHVVWKYEWTHFPKFFERQYLWNEAINHFVVFSPNEVMLRGIRYGNKKISECSFQTVRATYMDIYIASDALLSPL